MTQLCCAKEPDERPSCTEVLAFFETQERVFAPQDFSTGPPQIAHSESATCAALSGDVRALEPRDDANSGSHLDSPAVSSPLPEQQPSPSPRLVDHGFNGSSWSWLLVRLLVFVAFFTASIKFCSHGSPGSGLPVICSMNFTGFRVNGSWLTSSHLWKVWRGERTPSAGSEDKDPSLKDPDRNETADCGTLNGNGSLAIMWAKDSWNSTDLISSTADVASSVDVGTPRMHLFGGAAEEAETKFESDRTLDSQANVVTERGEPANDELLEDAGEQVEAAVAERESLANGPSPNYSASTVAPLSSLTTEAASSATTGTARATDATMNSNVAADEDDASRVSSLSTTIPTTTPDWSPWIITGVVLFVGVFGWWTSARSELPTTSEADHTLTGDDTGDNQAGGDDGEDIGGRSVQEFWDKHMELDPDGYAYSLDIVDRYNEVEQAAGRKKVTSSWLIPKLNQVWGDAATRDGTCRRDGTRAKAVAYIGIRLKPC